jgi:predicted transcriptional regulator
MKTNMTLHLDEEVVRMAKILAAQRGTSMSQLLADQIREMFTREAAYEAARRRAEERLAHGYELGWSKPATRDELHDREDLR